MAKTGVAPPQKHGKAQGLGWVKGHWSQTHVCNLCYSAAFCYNHPSLPTHSPLLPNYAGCCQTPHQPHPSSPSLTVCQLGCSAFGEQSKAARLHLWAGWSFPDKPLRNVLDPEPQASQGLCKHLSFTALGATSSRCEVPSSLSVSGKSLTKHSMITWLGVVTLLPKNECVTAFIN